jgi:SM-20-related protein
MRSLSPSPLNAVVARPFGAADIAIYDDFLAADEQQAIYGFLSGPGWAFGAYSDSTPGASRYWYKHFAGIVRDGREKHDPAQSEQQLADAAPLVAQMWTKLQTSVLSGHLLSRCYANGYPSGSEGGLHMDSNVPEHFTTIYYPHLAWHPNFAGETLFFDKAGSDIIAAVYPRPNRLVVFPGVIPHVARGLSRTCTHLRVTLMFKTMLDATGQPRRPGLVG